MYRNKSLTLIQRSLALAAGAMALLAASAGAQSPTGTSPNYAVPYSWPSFHAGRYEDPSTTGIDRTLTADEYLSQLLGTPSGLFKQPVGPGYLNPNTTVWTQIPSFLLGNYDPAQPPGGFGAGPDYLVTGVHNFMPNTFGTQNIAYWLAPYAYADAITGGGTLDDSDISGEFTTTGVVTQVSKVLPNDAASTAIGNEYRTMAIGGPTSSTTWNVTVPSTGSYSIVAHLPISAPNAAKSAHYAVTTDFGLGTANTTKLLRSQVLGGTINLISPVFLTAGTIVQVVLDNSNIATGANDAGSLAIADSVSLINAGSADETVDEDNTHQVGTGVFSTTGTWTAINAVTKPETAGSASFSSYLRAAVVLPTNGVAAAPTAKATWQFTPTTSGLYQASVHIPNSDTLAYNDATKEFRITDAHYIVTVTHGTVTHTVVDVKKSQTEANGSETLGAPFSVLANDVVKVILSNETLNTLPAGAASTFYVIADTMTLSQASGAVVDSSPVAVNDEEYPDIRNALYRGVLAGTVATPDTVLRGNLNYGDDTSNIASHKIRQLVYFGRNETSFGVGTPAQVDDTGSGPAFVKTGTWTSVLPAANSSALTAVNSEYITAPVGSGSGTAVWNIPVATTGVYSVIVHLPASAPNASNSAEYKINYNNGTPQTATVLRSQVAGGDVELLSSVILSEGTTVKVTLDDSANGNLAPAVVVADSASITTGSNRVGRVYCVDGLTGGVVWRYTLPSIDTKNSSTNTSTEIHSTPAIARFNVVTNDSGTTSAKKLCVVVADDGGRVYCLDAVGDRLGNSIDPTSPEVGNTKAYWIWRPDQNHVKVIKADGTQDNTKPDTTFDSAKDLFAPLAFKTASPTIYVNSVGNATVYIGNSNGVLYSLDATGVPAYSAASKDISPYLGSVRLLGGSGGLLLTPTVKPNWWFSVSGVGAGGAASAGIESAPALDATGTGNFGIYFGSSHELGGTSNYGRIYALSSTGPDSPPNNPNAVVKPGTKGYNTSVAAWEFPRARDLDATHKVRPALGSISGSPVVYQYPGAATKSIYFAANTGSEIPVGGTTASRDSDGATGRIWSITPAAASATFNWAYPTTIDPNTTASDTTPQTTNPIGGFVHATPAVGKVQFPEVIKYDPSNPKDYLHLDSVNNAAPGVNGKNVPMLYVGTAGLDNAMYALDINAPRVGHEDEDRGVYRIDAPNGSRFESSPALVVNSNTAYGNTTSGGNGGMVYCTAGTLLYQFSATPVSNNLKDPGDVNGVAYEQFARIAVDAIFGDCGPVSSPTVAGTNVQDLSTLAAGQTTNTSDWVYVGDTTTGFAKGLTPARQTFGGFDPGTFIPNPPPLPIDVTNPATVSPIETLHIHIFDGTAAHPNNSTDMKKENQINQPLPVFEWGDNAYIRVSNIVPSNPTNDPALRVADPNPGESAYYFTDGQPVTVQIGDVGPTITANDNGTIPNTNGPPATGATIALPADGFYGRSDTTVLDVLKDTGGIKWFGAYTYAIRDGTGRLNTPGSMRRVTLARQTAQVRAVADDSYVGTVTLQSQIGNSSVDPTFGILNPLAVIGQAPRVDNGTAVNLGSIGPNAAVTSPVAGAGLQALANGNSIYSSAVPPNGYSMGGSDPTKPADVAASTNYPTTYVSVATATGEINHGSSGTNKDLLGILDRSLLYATGGQLKVRMEESPLHWNDLTGINGAAATINPLPWETMPVSYAAGANRSPDYPDISSNGVSESLNYLGGSPITNLNESSGLLTEGGIPYATSSITLRVHAPKYQPANLTGGMAANAVANGYRTRVRVFVDSNQNNVWDFGEAYRDVDLQSGVLADMSTSVVENTTDIGAVPQGFGLNTESYASLGAFLPPGAPFLSPSGNYSQFFKPVTVHNDGNVNLANAQFDQKVRSYSDPVNNPGTFTASTISLLSESQDSSSYIPAFDRLGLTGLDKNGKLRYLVRTSVDHDLVPLIQNPVVAATGMYPGATLHKARVGDGAPTTLSIPDRSPDDYATSASPYISVAVPFGTPSGTYHQTLRFFEGMDPIGYNWLVGPTYAGGFAGHQTINSANASDAFSLLNTNPTGAAKYVSVQPYSEPGTTVKVTVTEARLTKGKIFGGLPGIDDNSASTGANYLPSAFRDLYWGPGSGAPSGSGMLNLFWTSTRSTPASIFASGLPGLASSFPLNGYSAAATSSWFTPAVVPTTDSGLNAGVSVTQEQHIFDAGNDRFSSSGAAYGFYSNIQGTQTNLYCAPIDMTSGAPKLGASTRITPTNDSTTKYGVRGLKVSSTLFGSSPATTFPSANGGNTPITDDLWAFWYTGGRGGSSIQYSSTTTVNGAITGGFRNPAILPIPAGLASVADPSAVLIPAPSPDDPSFRADPLNPTAPLIQVTYTGVSPDGNSDIYVSNYQPYHPYKSAPDDPNAVGGSIPDDTKVGLLLMPMPQTTEYLQPDANNVWWQARDVAWLRSGSVLFNIGGVLAAGGTPVYDRASGILTYTGITGGPNTSQTIYVDLARGRVRFRPSLPKATPVSATFQPQARRITTDPLADSAASTVYDQSYKYNENGLGTRITTDRMWYIYRKGGSAGAGTKPTLYYKTQRLTFDFGDSVGKPVSIKLDDTGRPMVSLYGGPPASPVYLYKYQDEANFNKADIDWKRGRVYFPAGYVAAYADVTLVDQNGNTLTLTKVPVTEKWEDEEVGVNTGASSTESKSGGTDTAERAIPMKTVVNESSVTAFLDPSAYANVLGGSYQFDPLTNAYIKAPTDLPHNIWLFWSSTRNGAGDIYSEVLNPRFSPDTP